MNDHLPLQCSDVKLLAVAWLDEQLSPAESEFMEEHLKNCSECDAFIHSLAQQKFDLPQLNIVENDAYWQDMDQVLQAELEQVVRTEKKVTWPVVLLYAAALLLSVVWGLQHRQRAIHLEKIVESQAQSLKHWERIAEQQSSENPKNTRPVKYVPARMEL